MYRLQNIQKAFTMLELIFVIVVLGIVSSIGSSIIANVYESYIVQRAVHDGGIKTELAINQLANRLTYRIDKTMIARDTNATPTYTFPPIANPTAYDARQVPMNKLNSHRALEWIGYDNDNFSAYANPAWSGFADINASNSSTFSTLYTPGSDTSKFADIYAGGQARALRFMGTADYKENAGTGIIDSYNVDCMYKISGCMFPVNINATQKLNFTGGDRVNGDMIYTEFYQLASSAFAIVPENEHTLEDTTVKVYDLVFYYGYQPWLGDDYKDGKHAVLLTDVSVFRFRKETNAIRLKLCSVERLGDHETISICKEKAVIR